jgi:hypothetical protein
LRRAADKGGILYHAAQGLPTVISIALQWLCVLSFLLALALFY